MRQVYILCKHKFVNKIKFYKSFFSINSIKSCSIFFFVKETLTFIITSIVLFFFYNIGVDYWGLDNKSINLIIAGMMFVQFLGYNKSSCNFIIKNIDLYRLSSFTRWSFLEQTVLVHCCTDFCFKLSSILPLIIFTILLRPQSMYSIFAGMLIGILVRVNETMHNLTKDIRSKLHRYVSLLKNGFALLIASFVLTIGFNVLKTSLFIVKVVLTSSAFEEAELLNELLMSFLDSITWVKSFLQNHSLLFIGFLIMLIVVPVINNIRNFWNLWNNKPSRHKNVMRGQYSYRLEALNSPYLKSLCQLRMNTTLYQIRKIPEIVIWIIIEIAFLRFIENDNSKILFIIWLLFISNSNYIRSLFNVGLNSFGNYSVKNDLFYWRLSNNNVKGMYEERFNLLMKYSKEITWGHSVLAIIFGIWFCSNKYLVFMSIGFILITQKCIHRFNCKLSCFSAFFIFASTCNSKIQLPTSDEGNFVEDKIQNMYKLPFVIIPMAILVANYIYSFVTINVLLIIVALFGTLMFIIDKQIDQYIQKAGDILEKINIPD